MVAAEAAVQKVAQVAVGEHIALELAAVLDGEHNPAVHGDYQHAE